MSTDTKRLTKLEQVKDALRGSDVWYVEEATEGGDAWFGEGVAARVSLMADDGNFLVAVIPCSSDDRGPGDEPWSEFVSSVSARGYVLRQDALNCGLHRLIVLMILPDDRTVHDGVSEAIASRARADFRTLILPSIDLSDGYFTSELRKARAAIGPLPTDKFLAELEESTLAEYLDESMLSDGRSRLAHDYAKGLLDDIQSMLRGDDSRDGEDWPAVRAVIAQCMAAAGVSTTEEMP